MHSVLFRNRYACRINLFACGRNPQSKSLSRFGDLLKWPFTHNYERISLLSSGVQGDGSLLVVSPIKQPSVYRVYDVSADEQQVVLCKLRHCIFVIGRIRVHKRDKWMMIG